MGLLLAVLLLDSVYYSPSHHQSGGRAGSKPVWCFFATLLAVGKKTSIAC